MSLQESIRQDLKTSMKQKDEARTSALRVLLGEFQRQEKKVLSDEEVVAIVRKLVKSETETLARSGGGSSPYMTVLEGYLPRQASEDEIRQWITANIDFGSFKNTMQAMRPIMAFFGSRADGNTVKKILEDL